MKIVHWNLLSLDEIVHGKWYMVHVRVSLKNV